MTASNIDKLARRARREAKHLGLRLRPAAPADRPLLHIVGCQRSGTTMMTELLDRDPRIRVHGELESLFDDTSRHHRMIAPDAVRAKLRRSGAAVDVVKPLVESHRIAELLELDSNAVAIWMFRHYEDVAASNLRRFGIDNGVRNLRAVVDDDPDDWRNAGLDAGTRSLVRDRFDPSMPPHDAAALFWYCRNSLLFSQDVDGDRVRTLRYEDLVRRPAPTVAALYAWVGLDHPPTDATALVRTDSVGKGRTIEIGDDVRALCDSMWDDLVERDRSHALVRSDTP